MVGGVLCTVYCFIYFIWKKIYSALDMSLFVSDPATKWSGESIFVFHGEVTCRLCSHQVTSDTSFTLANFVTLFATVTSDSLVTRGNLFTMVTFVTTVVTSAIAVTIHCYTSHHLSYHSYPSHPLTWWYYPCKQCMVPPSSARGVVANIYSPSPCQPHNEWPDFHFPPHFHRVHTFWQLLQLIWSTYWIFIIASCPPCLQIILLRFNHE